MTRSTGIRVSSVLVLLGLALAAPASAFFDQVLEDLDDSSRPQGIGDGGVVSAGDTLMVEGKRVTYYPSQPGIAEFYVDSKGYRNVYLLRCADRQFRWERNILLSTGRETGNNAGAEWKPMNSRSTITNAVYQAICPGMLAAGGAQAAPTNLPHPATNTIAQEQKASRHALSFPWYGTWESRDGTETLIIAQKRIDISKLREEPGSDGRRVQWSRRWRNADEADGSYPYTFGYSKSWFSRETLQRRFKEALHRQDEIFSVHAPEQIAGILDGLSTGEKETLWAYDEGDFDTTYVIDGDRLLEVTDTMYGFSVRQFQRVAEASKESGDLVEPNEASAAPEAENTGTAATNRYTRQKVASVTYRAEKLVLPPADTSDGGDPVSSTPAIAQTGLVAGVIESKEPQGNNFLHFTIKENQTNKDITVECSGDRTAVFSGGAMVEWAALTRGSEVTVSGEWVEQEGEWLLWASRVDVAGPVEAANQYEEALEEKTSDVSVRADKISVKDGSALSGTMAGGTLPFKSSFGKIKVNAADIEGFAAGKLHLTDGTVLNGAFVGGDIEIETSVGTLEVDAEEIVAIERGDGPAAQEGPELQAGQGRLTGRVVDPFGRPLPGATVRIVGTQFSAETDAEGSYQLSYVPGYMRVQVTRPGYESVEWELGLSQAAIYPIENKVLVPVKPDPLTAQDRRNMCSPQNVGRYNLISEDNRVQGCVERCPPGYYKAEDCRTFHDPKRRPNGTCIKACLPESKRGR